jgi:hypothetical protein
MLSRARLFWPIVAVAMTALTLWWVLGDLARAGHNGLILRHWGGAGLPVGRDFYNFWIYGVEALGPEPGRFFDPYRYWAFVK